MEDVTTSASAAFLKCLLVSSSLTFPLLLLYSIYFMFVKRKPQSLRLPLQTTYSPDIHPDRLFDAPTNDLSIIIPAYNEEKRLPDTLVNTYKYFASIPNFNFEIIIVSDGSTDDTMNFVHTFSSTHPSVRYVQLGRNKGKGFAVKTGFHFAAGEMVLFMDADGATDLKSFKKLNVHLSRLLHSDLSSPAVIFGSRAHLVEESMVRRSLLRTLLMKAFHLVVWSVVGSKIKDTQCGFKLFSRSASQIIIPGLHINRWAFDVEILYRALKLGVDVEEVAVDWEEKEGSKLNIASDSLQMLRDLVYIRLCYLFGIWTI
ncbi:hypothetical protein P9112_005862 [Eukaryota sp. TZLM1-RC]